MFTYYFLIHIRPHYTLNLQSIAISGQPFPNPTVFSISNAGGTIIDSGTTLAYLVEEVYNWIVSVVSFFFFFPILVCFLLLGLIFLGRSWDSHCLLAINFMIINYHYRSDGSTKPYQFIYMYVCMYVCMYFVNAYLHALVLIYYRLLVDNFCCFSINHPYNFQG